MEILLDLEEIQIFTLAMRDTSKDRLKEFQIFYTIACILVTANSHWVKLVILEQIILI